MDIHFHIPHVVLWIGVGILGGAAAFIAGVALTAHALAKIFINPFIGRSL